jgi:hypothetical protein
VDASSTSSSAESDEAFRPVSRSEDAIAFDRHLEASATDVADIARAVRETVLDGYPGAIEWFDPGNSLLAIGSERRMKALLFAIIPHRTWVNLQLADGAELPDPDCRVEGTGKRVRHARVRSIEDARSAWLRRLVAAQIAHRAR